MADLVAATFYVLPLKANPLLNLRKRHFSYALTVFFLQPEMQQKPCLAVRSKFPNRQHCPNGQYLGNLKSKTIP